MTLAGSPTALLWPDCMSEQGLSNLITPNALAQSAIFSTQQFRGPTLRPRYVKKHKLASLGHMSVYQLAGEQLDQGDADVFFELLRRVVENGDGSEREARVQFNRIELLRALGRTKGGNTIKLLTESLDRLTDATFYFQIPGLLTGRSRLILKSLTREDAPELDADYDVLIDVELSKLFSQEQWSFLRKSEREALAHDPLAKGLHGYFSTFKAPFPILVGTLQQLMSREGMQPSKFKEALKASLVHLRKATGWHRCDLAESGPNKGKVVIEKKKPMLVKKLASAPRLPTTQSWLNIQSNQDLAALSLAELEALMDGSANEEWAATRAAFNTDDKDLHWRAARVILERQWVAEQTHRLTLEFDDI